MKKPKVLIEMKHGLGDCVCTLPLVRSVRAALPDAYIALIVNGPANQAIFEHSGIPIDRYYYLSLKGRKRRETLKTLWQLRREHFDYGLLAVMTPARKGRMLLRMLGVRHALGEQYLGRAFNEDGGQEHCARRELGLLAAWPLPQGDPVPQLFVSDEERQAVRSYFSKEGKRTIVVNIGGGGTFPFEGKSRIVKSWPHMAAFVHALAGQEGVHVILLGAGLERPLLRDYEDLLGKDGGDVISAVGETSIAESLALLAEADLSIGVDTGMQHIAAALGTPTISVFGPSDPHVYAPLAENARVVKGHVPCQYCFPHEQVFRCQDQRCLSGVRIEDVLDAVWEVLR